MSTLLTGRQREIATLQKALASSEAEMVSVIGRRRVGKTFLIQSVYEKQTCRIIAGYAPAASTNSPGSSPNSSPVVVAADGLVPAPPRRL